MSNERFTNNARSTLGSAVGTSDTTITLASGGGSLFPSISGSQYFSITVFAAGSATGTPNEIMYCTARTGDTLTVLRAQESTPAGSWAVGDVVGNFPTAIFFNSSATISDTQLQPGNSAQDTGTANAGVIALNPAPSSLSALNGAAIRIGKTGGQNTGAYTLNVNGFGATPVLINGLPLGFGQLKSAQFFEVVYDGTNFELISSPAGIQNETLAQMSSGYVKGNISGSITTPSDISLSALASAMSMPPLPNASGGVGQWQAIPTATNLIYLPAGGTWAYFYINNGAYAAGIGAGTVALYSGPLSGTSGFCWRIT